MKGGMDFVKEGEKRDFREGGSVGAMVGGILFISWLVQATVLALIIVATMEGWVDPTAWALVLVVMVTEVPMAATAMPMVEVVTGGILQPLHRKFDCVH